MATSTQTPRTTFATYKGRTVFAAYSYQGAYHSTFPTFAALRACMAEEGQATRERVAKAIAERNLPKPRYGCRRTSARHGIIALREMRRLWRELTPAQAAEHGAKVLRMDEAERLAGV